MDRSRLPSAMGILHLTLRLTTLLLSHIALTLTLYLAVAHSSINPVLYATLIWCAIIDTAEILALITKPEDRLGRIPTWLMFANETLVVSLYIVAWVVAVDVRVEDRGEGCRGAKGDDGWKDKVAWLRRLWFCVLCQVVIRVVMVVVMIVDEARVRRRSRGRFGASRRGIRGRLNAVTDIVREARR